MAPILALAGGAGDGLQEALHQMLLEHQLELQQQQVNETGRHNVADEGNVSRRLGIDEAYKNAEISSLNEDRASKKEDRNSIITKRTQDAADEQKRRQQEQDFINTPSTDPNVQKQQALIKLRSITGDKGSIPYQIVTEPNGPPDHSAPGPVEKGPNGELFRVGRDNVTTPITQGPGGPQAKGYIAPVLPGFYAGGPGDTPKLYNKNTGLTKDLTSISSVTGKAEPLQPKKTAQEANRNDMASKISSHFDDAQNELDEANRRGLLGPLAGRTFVQFLSDKLGTTGNPENDDLLGALQFDLGAARSGFASLHGRGGANAGVARDIQKKMDEGFMSYDLLKGNLREMRKWVDGYAGDQKKGASGAGGTIKMVAPDGRSLTVPADKVQELEAAGAKRVQ